MTEEEYEKLVRSLREAKKPKTEEAQRIALTVKS